MLKVIEEVKDFQINEINPTEHFKKRWKRYSRMKERGYRAGEPIKMFLCDSGHINGLEYHIITSMGLIFIENANTGKMVTFLIARDGQLKRYYNAIGEDTPYFLINLGKRHIKQGANGF